MPNYPVMDFRDDIATRNLTPPRRGATRQPENRPEKLQAG